MAGDADEMGYKQGQSSSHQHGGKNHRGEGEEEGRGTEGGERLKELKRDEAKGGNRQFHEGKGEEEGEPRALGEPPTQEATQTETEHEGADDHGDGFDVDAENREQSALPDDLIKQCGEAGQEEEGREPACRGDQVLSVYGDDYGILKLVLVTIEPKVERPKWLRAPAPVGDNYRDLKQLVTDLRLHTVCESAACPNIGDCWNRRTATFMILGNVCTRRCGFCAVQKGAPLEVDMDEPRRVAEAVALMGLRYAVVTSVNRDDRKDGGALLFAMTIEAIRERVPGCQVEVLVPDFQGKHEAMEIVMNSAPDVLNHNTETVPRLYRMVRLGARYERSLDMLAYAKQLRPQVPTKSGVMLGLGETREEVLQVMRDLRAHNVDIFTLGQYLRPSPKHLPIMRYVPIEEFNEYRAFGYELGFAHVEAGPLVRSSYHADEGVSSAFKMAAAKSLTTA